MHDSSDEKMIGRRGFFKAAFTEITKKLVEISLESESKTVRQRKYLRPPGAVEETLFLSRCTRCNECIRVCPHYCVRGIDSDVEYGIGTPVIIPEITPCRLCPDLPCISACKDKALMPVTDVSSVRIGIALIDRNNCNDYSPDASSPCNKCYTECPLKGDAIYLEDSKPVIGGEKCTGCGICENVCAAVSYPPAVRVIPKYI
ncbi:MAG: 4Fe-4S dicluster domain-containing protein [Nitrospirae bacterium]|nr:4Fe-4S dicluster domain-containing protein [Nitrospirota bacterium]